MGPIMQQGQENAQTWINELKVFNRSIEDLTSCIFVILTDPTLPQLELNNVKSNFHEFNSRIKQLVEPVAKFLSAFGNLISKESLTLATEGFNDEDLTLFEFPTKKSYFSSIRAIQEQLKQASHVSIESTEFYSGVQVERDIRQLFLNHFRYKSVRALLAEQNISYTQVYGKGDHLKLFIDGSLIVIPAAHTYLRLGTKRNIENQLLASVKEAIAKQRVA